MKRKAFTLLELLVVMGIMGMMAVMSVGGYRAMQRGMEERGVMENANHFIRAAYRRAQIDRQPVAVYFWNETLREETDTEPMIVVGKAVAVRRAGRVSRYIDPYLYDEFGDRLLIGIMPKMSTAAEADEARQRAEAAAFVEKFCSDPKKPCFVNKTAAREMTPAFAEELYRLSRLRYLG